MAETKGSYEEVEYKKFIDEFKSESDRAAVILGAAKLDLLLYQLLSKTLIPNTASKDELLDNDAPLSTFSARICTAHRLGLINADLVRALTLIRKIRNGFAHEITGCKLDSGSHKDRVDELIIPFGNENFNQFKEAFFGKEHSASVNFRTALAIIIIRLTVAIQYAKSLRGTVPTTLIPTTW